MAGENGLLPVYTIQVGKAGTFTNDADTNISATLNAEIASAPAGYQIHVIFNPGVYGEDEAILLPSNTSITGNDSTLEWYQGGGVPANGALIANADTYNAGNQIILHNSDGTTTTEILGPNDTATMASDPKAIIDNNISIQGMTFNDTGTSGYTNYNTSTFGTWFTNATNIDVQNNVYIGGGDGNAFVDVANGVVASNIAVGQYNASYDNWNGPTNVTIEGNATFMSGTSDTGWSVLVNSTPSGNPANPGNAQNDGVVANTFSGYWVSSSSVATTPLLSYGYTTITGVTEQGNTSSCLGVPNSGNFYTADVANEEIEDNVFTGITSASSNGYSAISVFSSSTTQPDATSNTEVSGNLVVEGSSTNITSPLIFNEGLSPTTINNAVIGQSTNTAVNATVADDLNNTGTTAGNFTAYATTVSGGGVAPNLSIMAPVSITEGSASTVSVAGVSIVDLNENDVVTVTLSAVFGSLTLSKDPSLEAISMGDEQAFIITGQLAEVNAQLSSILYTPNSAEWDDSIEVKVSTSSGLSSSRYIPVLSSGSSGGETDIITIPGGLMASMAGAPSGTGGATTSLPSLNGALLISSAGNAVISMGSTASAVFLGSGSNTVYGGTSQGYISTETGLATIELSEGGDITIAAGTGSVQVAAALGNDLIEAGSSTATVLGGCGSDTVTGGLGDLTVLGGAGQLLVSTLPQDGGNLTAILGTGNATVLALSGYGTITTKSSTNNLIDLGIGKNIVSSSGDDTIQTGAGADTIFSEGDGRDLVEGGFGTLYFRASAGSASIAPAAMTTIVAGTGNLVIEPGGNFNLELDSSGSTQRVIVLPGVSAGVALNGFGSNPVEYESLAGQLLTVTLSDGTTLQILDAKQTAFLEVNGNLASTTLHLSSGSSYQILNYGSNQTEITSINDTGVPCFLRGTTIRTPTGEVTVEQLEIGNEVVTYTGASRHIKWIGRRFYKKVPTNNPDVSPVLLKKGALGNNVPSADLCVSPLHGIFLGGRLFPAGGLVNGATIISCSNLEDIDYFHVELDSHDLIVANGAVVETFLDCNSRKMFDNACEYHQLYPGEGQGIYASELRIEDGPELERMRYTLARHVLAPKRPMVEETVGFVEAAIDGICIGWAHAPSDPHAPVQLDVFNSDAFVARVIANGHRPDVKAAGYQTSRCGFRINLREHLRPNTRHEISIRPAGSTMELAGSPVAVDASTETGVPTSSAWTSRPQPLAASAQRHDHFQLHKARRGRVFPLCGVTSPCDMHAWAIRGSSASQS